MVLERTDKEPWGMDSALPKPFVLFKKYEVIIHRPFNRSGLVIREAANDTFRVVEVKSHILHQAGVRKHHLLVQVGEKKIKSGDDPIAEINKKKQSFPLSIIFSKPVSLFLCLNLEIFFFFTFFFRTSKRK